MWIAAGLIETIIVGFAIYGIYALCTRGSQPSYNPSYSQNDSRPNQQPNQPNNNASSGSSEDSDGTVENNANVQMGIVCYELPDQYAAYYNIEKGLVVKSFAADSPALETDLRVSDVITAINGVRVTSFEELFAVLEKLSPNDEVTLTCYRMVQSGDTYKADEPFQVTFRVQEKHESASSSYPGA